MGFFGSSGGRGSLWTSWEGWSAEASYGRSEFVERSYADGGFTASAGFHRPLDENDFSHFGIVTGLHEKTVGEGAFALGFPRRNGVTLRGGWEPYRVRYENALGPTPDDGGRLDRTFVEVRTGFLDREGFGDLGALLGFGLADLEERLKPLAVPKTQFGSGLTVRRGDNWTGSGKSYTTEIINSRLARSWGGQNKLSLSASAGAGENLPNSLEIATGRDLGLMGQYAREFRGREAAAATLSYSRPFRLTHRGVWQGIVFAEAARAWDGEQRTKEGVGASFYYRFWRFPLPFGFTVTRSLDDHNTQVSAAVGGRF
jgi:hypothetical protein